MLEARIKIMLAHNDARVPTFATAGAAGFDLYALEPVVIEPGEIKEVPTGIYLELPQGYYIRIESRSGLAIKGISRVAGIIDNDYRGEVSPILHNTTSESFFVKKHDRVAQALVSPIIQARFEITDNLGETERGDKRFNSTGR